MKTALQELRTMLDKKLDEFDKYKANDDYYNGAFQEVNKIIAIIDVEIMKKEMQQIKTAFNQGKWENLSGNSLGGGGEYYEKTFLAK